MAKVSVLMPVYNSEPTVGIAVQSILSQAHENLELIVVDDGSTDGTAAVLQQFKDPRLRVARQSHAGVAAAANHAYSLAGGSYVARMDADDRALPNRLTCQLDWLERHDLDVVGCQVRIRDRRGACPASLLRYQEWINEETLTSQQILSLRFVELPLVNPTILARRCYFEIGFSDSDVPEDYDLFLKAMAKGIRPGKVPEVLLEWSDLPTRLTRNDARYSTEAFERCRRRHLISGPLHACRTVDLWGAGSTGKPWLRWLTSEGVSVRNLIDVHPRKIGHRIHGCLVKHPDEMAKPAGIPLIVAVGSQGARPLITKHLFDRGYQPGIDTWFVA